MNPIVPNSLAFLPKSLPRRNALSQRLGLVWPSLTCFRILSLPQIKHFPSLSSTIPYRVLFPLWNFNINLFLLDFRNKFWRFLLVFLILLIKILRPFTKFIEYINNTKLGFISFLLQIEFINNVDTHTTVRALRS